MALTIRHSLVVAVVGLLAGGCNVKKTEAPPLSGPSELGTAITLRATPDTLPQDGFSQSEILIEARDANAQPVRSLGVRAEIAVNGVLQDFGMLSSKNLMTGSDGRTSVTYTAPKTVTTVDRQTTVSILVTPAGSDARNQVPRSVDIRLVPTGVITPPNNVAPDFEISNEGPDQMQVVTFIVEVDAKYVSYSWDFGDGATASGPSVQHQFRDSGDFAVTLTVADATGARFSRSKVVSVKPGAAPTAAFVFSPAEPTANKPVYFNAATSIPNPGRTLERFVWNFGDGATGQGITVSHTYSKAGKYVVTVTVTDDVGATASTSSDVEVN
jgi:PKD repeat protein